MAKSDTVNDFFCRKKQRTTLLMIFFVVKNKGQTQKASDPKVADRQHVDVEKNYAMIGVELRPCGYKSVLF